MYLAAIHREVLRSIALAASLIIAGACTEPDVRTPNALVVVAGAGQEGEAGMRLSTPIRVQVTDVHGRPVPRVIVTFEITTSAQPGFTSGALSAARVDTDLSGIARADWTLGTAAGAQTLRVGLEASGSASTLFTEVTATARPGPLASIRRASDPVVAITVGDSAQVTVVGVDRFGNVTPNVSGVSWHVVDPVIASPSGSIPAPDRATIVARAPGSTVLEARHSLGGTARFDLRTYVGPGRDIAYESAGAIYLLSADGTTTTALGPGTDPAWSPDGRQIAFTSGGAIYVMNADGSGRRALTDPATGLRARQPTWSPDGRKIAFNAPASRRNDDGSIHSTDGALFVMNADGTAPTLVLFKQCGTLCSGVRYPAWSPDGTRFAYSTLDLLGPGAQASVFVVNADGSGDRPLRVGGVALAWSPDGGRIAFESHSGRSLSLNPSAVYAINSDDTGLERLSVAPSAESWDISPTWSPDARIAFVRVPAHPASPVALNGPSELFVINGDGTEVRRVLNATNAIRRPAWRPSP